jgi:hypothetical protein
MKIPKQAYTAEFKELAVKRIKDGQAIPAVAKELELSDQTLRNWAKASAAGKLKAAGPVDVPTADHHGLFDGLSADTVRSLRPQAWVIPGWHISHPDLQQLECMFSERLYP